MSPPKTLKGIPASPKIAIGNAFVYEREVTVERRKISGTEVEKELERFEGAVENSKKQLARLEEKTTGEIGEKEAKIFRAQKLMLEDPTLLKEIRGNIESGENAEGAVQDAIKDFVSMFEGMKDEYFRERAIDVQDVGDRVIRNLTGRSVGTSLADLREKVVLVAETLTPSDTANMNKENVLGFATDKGGLTSHVAIISREYGIPAVVGLGNITQSVKSGDLIIVDGSDGVVTVDPDEATLKKYEAEKARIERRQIELKKIVMLPALTLDGRKVELAANIGEPKEVGFALSQGAESVGLFRTEFLYHGRNSLPTEEDQFKAYKAVAEEMGEKSVIIRTLDVGGDKPPPYLEMPKELNPFLGWRAIRISLDRPDIFKTQLRAILRAGVYGNLKIMYPMISSVEETRAANELLEESKRELSSKDIPFGDVEVGIMIETPSAALVADSLAREVDFFSIGTNDLTQYTLAVDRTNETVSRLFDTFHPALLRLIKNVIDASHAAGIWTGMCGEFAGDPLATPVLLGLDLDEFSMNAVSLPEVKKIVRSIKYSEAKKMAEEALRLSTIKETRSLAKEFLARMRITLL